MPDGLSDKPSWKVLLTLMVLGGTVAIALVSDGLWGVTWAETVGLVAVGALGSYLGRVNGNSHNGDG